jgi:hypothetical protein
LGVNFRITSYGLHTALSKITLGSNARAIEAIQRILSSLLRRCLESGAPFCNFEYRAIRLILSIPSGNARPFSQKDSINGPAEFRR